MPGQLSYLVTAIVDDNVTELEGKTLGRPALLVSDGENLTYGVDVDIGRTQIDPNTADEVVTPLREVPIAAGNKELLYADVGAAVKLRRRAGSGRFEVIGFAKNIPGTYTRYAMTFGDFSADPIVIAGDDGTDVGLSARRLTWGELGTLGVYGVTAYGAIGVFRGETLVEIRTV